MRAIDWGEFAGGSMEESAAPLALTIGVFDGLHLGHRALISRVRAEEGCVPTVVTFRQNPAGVVSPGRIAPDIFALSGKLALLEALGVGLAVLVDFSREFSKISGRDFIDLLLSRRPVRLIALGEDFRCGRGLDVGAREIAEIARGRGIEAWIAPPVTDGGRPVSSSRIRLALAQGRAEEARRLLGGSAEIEPGAALKWLPFDGGPAEPAEGDPS